MSNKQARLYRTGTPFQGVRKKSLPIFPSPWRMEMWPRERSFFPITHIIGLIKPWKQTVKFGELFHPNRKTWTTNLFLLNSVCVCVCVCSTFSPHIFLILRYAGYISLEVLLVKPPLTSHPHKQKSVLQHYLSPNTVLSINKDNVKDWKQAMSDSSNILVLVCIKYAGFYLNQLFSCEWTWKVNDYLWEITFFTLQKNPPILMQMIKLVFYFQIILVDIKTQFT